MDAKKWTFPLVIYQYLENYDHFYWGKSFQSEIFSIELKKLQSLIYAYTGVNYNVESAEGRDKIKELFDTAFGLSYLICTDEQIEKLRSLFPHKAELFDLYQDEKPLIADFYTLIFDLLRQGFEYITLFSAFGIGDVMDIISQYKEKEIDKHVDDKDDILVEAIMVLLGDNFRKSFSRKELIAKYKFPNTPY